MASSLPAERQPISLNQNHAIEHQLSEKFKEKMPGAGSNGECY
jgi:hypothetical protein